MHPLDTKAGEYLYELMTSRRAEERKAPKERAATGHKGRKLLRCSGILGLQIRSLGWRSAPAPANIIINSRCPALTHRCRVGRMCKCETIPVHPSGTFQVHRAPLPVTIGVSRAHSALEDTRTYMADARRKRKACETILNIEYPGIPLTHALKSNTTRPQSCPS